MNDKASLEKALEGSHTVYAVTNYWEKMDAALEEQQGRNIADAAKVKQPPHSLIWPPDPDESVVYKKLTRTVSN